MSNDEGARRRIAARALACLDLTELSDGASVEKIDALCEKANGPHGPVAAVCIGPEHVAHAKARLEGTPIRIATVANFPEGDLSVEEVEREITTAIAAGADEIDIVIPWRALTRGEPTTVAAMVGAARKVCEPPVVLKTILETGALGEPRLIKRACEMALAGGTDFLKTSTGKTPLGATPEAAEIMLDMIKTGFRPVGLKVSGGVRRYADAAGYLGMADAAFGEARPENFRIGASGLLAELEAVLEGRTPPSEDDGY